MINTILAKTWTNTTLDYIHSTRIYCSSFWSSFDKIISYTILTSIQMSKYFSIDVITISFIFLDF